MSDTTLAEWENIGAFVLGCTAIVLTVAFCIVFFVAVVVMMWRDFRK
jgi:hypothetical protein